MDDLTAAMIKGLGSISGSVLALIFQPPKNNNDFVVRAAFSVVSGMIFADPIRLQYLHWPESWQMWLASGALVSLASWWVMGAAIRVLGAWKPK